MGCANTGIISGGDSGKHEGMNDHIRSRRTRRNGAGRRVDKGPAVALNLPRHAPPTLHRPQEGPTCEVVVLVEFAAGCPLRYVYKCEMSPRILKKIY